MAASEVGVPATAIAGLGAAASSAKSCFARMSSASASSSRAVGGSVRM